MNAKVDKNVCIGCGLCTTTCPNVFQLEDDGLAAAYTNPVPDADQDSAQDACDNCPVSAISIDD